MLRRMLRDHADKLRFRHGDATMDLDGLVRALRSDLPIELVEPEPRPLPWSPELARRWAADVVEQVLSLAGEGDDIATLTFAVATARRVADGELPPTRLDAMFAELWAEEWPSYEPPFIHVVEAARQLVARDELAASPHGSGLIEPGRWAAAAATHADAAATAAGEPARGRAYQATRLVHYLLPT